ncbi:MAG: hypothetical protein WAT19_14785 [Ferruginibacter sp.]
MKKIIILCAMLLGVSYSLFAQPRSIKKMMELKMPKTADDLMCGTRGASVAWDPAGKKYYAAFAGNAGFPLGVFDASGRLLTDTSLNTQRDIRALWYNPISKKISGNCYNDGGWFSYSCNAKAVPTACQTDVEGMYQPDEQSAGAFDPVSKSVFFLDGGKLSFYRNTSKIPFKTVALHWGRPKILGPADFESPDDIKEGYNSTSAVYTGLPNAQVAVLNVTRAQIELYDYNEGYLQQILLLPEGTSVEYVFNFSYANGFFWLFDIDTRTWLAFK